MGWEWVRGREGHRAPEPRATWSEELTSSCHAENLSGTAARAPAGPTAAPAQCQVAGVRADVLPLWVAELGFELAPPIAATLTEAIQRSDTGYAWQVEGSVRRWPSSPAGAGTGSSTRPRSFRLPMWAWEMVDLLRALAGRAIPVISPPVYPPFFAWVPEVPGRLVEVPLCRDDGWRLDLPALERAFAATAGRLPAV